MDEAGKVIPAEAQRDLHLFRKCMPLRMKLHEVLRYIDDTQERTCLDIGAGNAMISYHLRNAGGEWHTVTATGSGAASARALLDSNVGEFSGLPLPFEDKTFDIVVVLDFLQEVKSPDEFIAECHRILKPDGRLIVNVAHSKSWTPIRPLRSLLGLSYEKLGLLRPGYSESRLFNILKHGFDVHQMRSYSRFFVELTDVVVQAIVRRITMKGDASGEKSMRFYSGAGLFYRLAFQFDLLLFFTRGHALIAVAKRRGWRPRNAPVLTDGRTLTEVVLSRASG